MTTAKRDIFIGLQLEHFYLVGGRIDFRLGGNKGMIICWGESNGGGLFQVGEGRNKQIFGWWGDS